MKKTILLFTLLMLVGSVFAQMKKDRTSAYNYWMKKNYVKAKEYIDKAVTYPEASSDAKVWFYRGGIYLDILSSGAAPLLAPDAMKTAYDSYVMAKDLDKGGEYKEDIATRISMIGGEYFNAGLDLFKTEKFEEAIPNFEKAIELSKQSQIMDTNSYYAAGLCYKALILKDSMKIKKAIEYYQFLADLKTKKPEVFIDLIDLYAFNKQADKAIATVKAARELFPNNAAITIAEANIYLQTNDFAKAIDKLKIARENEPNNLMIHHALGSSYDRLRDNPAIDPANKQKYFDEAVNCYKKAIELNPNFFDATFNLGVMYYNKGGDLVNEANKLPINESEKYEKLIGEGNDFLNLALPYLEKCAEIQPNDNATLISLKEIYTRLKMMDKLQKINEKFK